MSAGQAWTGYATPTHTNNQYPVPMSITQSGAATSTYGQAGHRYSTEHLVFGKYTYEKKNEGLDYEGNDVGELFTADMELCAKNCNSIDNCVGVAVAVLEGRCWLKSAFEGTGVQRARTNYVKTTASAALVAAHAELKVCSCLFLLPCKPF